MSASKSSKSTPTSSKRLTRALKDIETIVTEADSPTLRGHIIDMIYGKLDDIETKICAIHNTGR